VRFTDGIERYVAVKRTQGIEFLHGKSDLMRLARITGDIELSDIKRNHILALLNESSLANVTWRLKYYVLMRFFDYWTAYGEMPELLMPPIKPKVRRDHLPYVFTRTELRAIIRAANDPRYGGTIHPQTMRTFLIVLYGSGARVGEVLQLRIRDVNLSKRTLVINNKNPNRSRTIPIGADLVEILRKFLAWRSKRLFESPCLFVKKKGKPIIQELICREFRRLREIANVTRERAASTGPPRMMDFQCSFAVHRINSWILGKKDMNRLLPALAVYMGFSGLNTTQRYLHMAPARFKQHLNKLSPFGMKRHWRTDQSLMQFLDSL
jgi:integrase/recombinase XerD